MKKILVLISILCLICVTCGAQIKTSGSKKRSISSSIKDSITTTEKKNNTTKSILNSFYDDEGYLLAYEDLPNLKGYNPNKPILENEEEALNYILSNIDFVCNYNPGFYKSDILYFKIKNGKITNVDHDKATIFKDSLFYKKIKLNQKSLPNFYIPIAYLYSKKLSTKRISTYQLEILHTNNKRYYDSITLKKEIKKNLKTGKYQTLTSKELNLIIRLNLNYNYKIKPENCILERGDLVIDTTQLEIDPRYGCLISEESEYRFKRMFRIKDQNLVQVKKDDYSYKNIDIIYFNDSSLLRITNNYNNRFKIYYDSSLIFNMQDTITGNYFIRNPLVKDKLIFIHSEIGEQSGYSKQLIEVDSYEKMKKFRFGLYKKYILYKIKGSSSVKKDSIIYLLVNKKEKKKISKNKIIYVSKGCNNTENKSVNYFHLIYDQKFDYINCDSENVHLVNNEILCFLSTNPYKSDYSSSESIENEQKSTKANIYRVKIVRYLYYSPTNFLINSVKNFKYQCRVGFNAKKNDPTGKYKDPIIYYLEKGL